MKAQKATRDAIIAFILIFAGRTCAAANAEKGADVFDTNCAECHSVAQSMKIKKGPSLYGILGRSAGTQAGFEYSPAMTATRWIWDKDTLDRYVAAPKVALPGGIMKFDGLPSAAERADLIAFLSSLK